MNDHHLLRASQTVVDERDPGRSIIRFELCLSAGKIYTLQGDNGSGKSTIIKTLMGVLRPRHGRGIDISINGKLVSFRTPADAIRCGVVAVFQFHDDGMIPSMSVRQQLRLRHACSHWKLFMSRDVGILGKWVIDQFERVSKISMLPPSLGSQQEVDEKAAELLRAYGDGTTVCYENNLDKLPRDLSGGEKAVARLVSAQLTPGIRVLLLDEVFAGVQIEVWPQIVDRLRMWAHKHGVAVLSVTHNPEEIIRWQPDERFEIVSTSSGRELTKKPPLGYHSLAAGVPQRVSWFPIFNASPAYEWIRSLNLKHNCVLMADQSLVQLECYVGLRDALIGHVGRSRFTEICIPTSEKMKVRDESDKVFDRVAKALPTNKGTVVIAGGGVMLNFGGYIAANLHRGVPMILVPTTIMAIADVAVGSKTALNDIGPNGALKHSRGVYANPWALLLDFDFLRGLPALEVIFGLAECLKHGLLQDMELYNRVLNLLRCSSPDEAWRRQAFEVARSTMRLKSDVLLIDPWEEKGLGFILLYGHLHAHSLERLSNFSLPHGLAVYLGILLDLTLAGPSMVDAYNEVLSAVKTSGVARHAAVLNVFGVAIAPENANALKVAYDHDPKPQHFAESFDTFRILKVEKVAQFAGHTDNATVSEAMVPVSFKDIVRSIMNVWADLKT